MTTVRQWRNAMMKRRQWIAYGISFALLFAAIPAGGVSVSAAKKPGLSVRTLTVVKGKSKTLKVKNAKKKVKWKILSGKKCITLQKKSNIAVAVIGRKKGTAKVRAVIGKTKLLCKVTVKNKPSESSKPSESRRPSTTTRPSTTARPSTTTRPSTTVRPLTTAGPSITAGPLITAGPSETTGPSETPGLSATTMPVETVNPTEAPVNVENYSYEVIPLMAPFNSYFYIKTDNPDPDSFQFADKETKYSQSGTYEEGEFSNIAPTDDIFSDVEYEDQETRRVKGGYIASVSGVDTDGGELCLQTRRITGAVPVFDLNTGETVYEKKYEYNDTSITVKVEPLEDVVDYLISTYGDSSKSYFDNLSGIQSGFQDECLYRGVYVLGEQKVNTAAPYYGLSTSPHVDQDFYIQSPYHMTGNKSMLVSELYPMRYDSIGFPSVMMTVARKLDSTATVQWSSDAHYLIDVTYNGETCCYGGEGSGGGQGINADQIKYWYTFDGSTDDAYMKRSLKEISAMIQEYGELKVPKEPKDQPELTWESVRQTVGKDGAYVKLTVITSIFGWTAEGYTFLYDNGSTLESSMGRGAVGYFSNAWYDGRYFNRLKYYYPGAKFEETVEDVSPSLVMKDVTLKLPDDGNTYYFNYRPIDKADQYDPETGKWSGFMQYNYDPESQTWKADVLGKLTYCNEDEQFKKVDDQQFIDECTITMDEALAMNLDANTDKEPTSYYIYDQMTSPGTYYSASN